jgi:hypothetical protein
MKRTDIPNPRTPGALAVTDGTTCIGYIVHDDTYFAFDADNVLIGEYATQREAMRAMPAANTVSNDELKLRHTKTTSRNFARLLRRAAKNSRHTSWRNRAGRFRQIVQLRCRYDRYSKK